MKDSASYDIFGDLHTIRGMLTYVRTYLVITSMCIFVASWSLAANIYLGFWMLIGTAIFGYWKAGKSVLGFIQSEFADSVEIKNGKFLIAFIIFVAVVVAPAVIYFLTPVLSSFLLKG